MQYIAVELQINTSSEENSDILIALLDSLNYEGITEKEIGLVIAYIPKGDYDRNLLEITLSGAKELHAILISEEIIQPKNWNEEWEKNFEPVIVDEQCVIRAPFHESFDAYDYVLTIEPKMSFGTGHHNTTSLMISQILKLDCKGKTLLDMGCGTGVLGILCKKKEAEIVVAIDVDEWAYENTNENMLRNDVEMKVLQGRTDVIPKLNFDFIFANINRNILIDQVNDYFRHLKSGGELFISGILFDDIQIIKDSFTQAGFTFNLLNSKGNWQLMSFKK